MDLKNFQSFFKNLNPNNLFKPVILPKNSPKTLSKEVKLLKKKSSCSIAHNRPISRKRTNSLKDVKSKQQPELKPQKMDGSAADDLKSLKLLIKDLSEKLVESRNDEVILDDLVQSIAVDASIDYNDFKKRQLNKSKEYFKLDNLPHILSTDSVNNNKKLTTSSSSSSISELSNINELDKQILHLQQQNILYEKQIQRNEFLASKYLQVLDREEEILKGLNDFMKDKEFARSNGEKIINLRFQSERKVIQDRVDKLKKRNLQEDKTFDQLEKIWKIMAIKIGDDLNNNNLQNDFEKVYKDVEKLMDNFRMGK